MAEQRRRLDVLSGAVWRCLALLVVLSGAVWLLLNMESARGVSVNMEIR